MAKTLYMTPVNQALTIAELSVLIRPAYTIRVRECDNPSLDDYVTEYHFERGILWVRTLNDELTNFELYHYEDRDTLHTNLADEPTYQRFQRNLARINCEAFA